MSLWIAREIAIRHTPSIFEHLTAETSVIALDRNGALLRAATTSQGRWRLPISQDDVDPLYLRMLLAFEDRRFYQHTGVDLRAVVRAATQAARSGRIVSGASTLTMQVARLMADRHGRTFSGKLLQAGHALQLERKLSKRAILETYLALAPFGGNLEGVRAASLAYFRKEPRHLSIAQAALLVALPQSPEARRPDRHGNAAKRARDRVIDVAVRRGIVSADDADQAKLEPVPTVRRAFPMTAAHLVDRTMRANPDRKVHRLTIDARLQVDLEALAAQAARRTAPRTSIAILVADHATGEVLAHIGSAGYTDRGRLGAIDMTAATRSPGSTLKPFVYAIAFDRGLAHPETLIDDRPTRFGAYAPTNFQSEFRGTVTIREALAASLNIPAVKVLNAVGPGRFAARLRRAGVELALPGDAVPNLSLALGGVGTTLRDLVTLYAALARGGEPVTLFDETGPPAVAAQLSTSETGVAPRGPRKTRQLVRPESADAITRILRAAPPPPNARGGAIAFKTGTSYGHRDAWAIGYDGRHVVGVWVGRADASAVPDLVGRTAAAPVLFDAFERISRTRAPFPRSKSRMAKLDARDLPMPLRRFERDVADTASSPYLDPPIQIAFPPDRSEIALDAGAPIIVLRAEGGQLPLTWLVDGVPIAAPGLTREHLFRPHGQGFVKLVVMDARGRTDRVTVRLHQD